MDDKEHIKKHYNNTKNISNYERRNTKNINIRNANNAIKFGLIIKYIKMDDTVLDLGVGKGGDFHKYNQAKIKELYGIDIANRSILDAIVRMRDVYQFPFKLRLKVKDAFGEHFDLKRKFDVVSCQLAFHYAFVCKNTFQNAIANINRHMKVNGYFIFTTLSKKVLMERKRNGKLKNNYHEIVFKHPEKSNLIFGNSYYFSLVDSIYNCIEYIVDIDELILEFKKYNIELVEIISFSDVLKNDDYLNIIGSKIDYIKILNKEEREVFSLHDLVVFKKLEE